MSKLLSELYVSVCGYEIIGPPSQGPWLEEIDKNLFYSDIGEFKATVHFRHLGSKARIMHWRNGKGWGWIEILFMKIRCL